MEVNYCDRCKLIHARPSKACDEFVPGEMTEEQGIRLLALSHELKNIAAPFGSLHCYWDVAFDIDLFVKRGRPIMKKTAEEWIAYAEKCITDAREIL